ncbi:MAG: hypothetical protein ACTS5A_02645 [Candidatus Hodgkinia cicadicola]
MNNHSMVEMTLPVAGVWRFEVEMMLLPAHLYMCWEGQKCQWQGASKLGA